MPSREDLAKVFRDTKDFYENDPFLRETINFSISHTKIYPADFSEEISRNKEGHVRVIKGRTLETATWIHKIFPEKKIAVLNFASSTRPGGGVLHGSRAQEESICRSSTLYAVISTDAMKEGYYTPNRENYRIEGTDKLIYSPNVIVFRNDNDYIPSRMAHEDFFPVDVITCAAPHIHEGEYIPDNELFDIHVRRAENILRAAALNDVDIFITGAFGCGAFHNDPNVVASAYKHALRERHKNFDYVVFAIYCNSSEIENFRAFHEVFN